MFFTPAALARSLASRKIADDLRAADYPDEYPVALISFAFDRAAISAARSTARKRRLRAVGANHQRLIAARLPSAALDVLMRLPSRSTGGLTFACDTVAVAVLLRTVSDSSRAALANVALGLRIGALGVITTAVLVEIGCS
jgi:hypothetical protein